MNELAPQNQQRSLNSSIIRSQSGERR